MVIWNCRHAIATDAVRLGRSKPLHTFIVVVVAAPFSPMMPETGGLDCAEIASNVTSRPKRGVNLCRVIIP